MVIEELREYVFALFAGDEVKEGVVSPESLTFLGTAFFVTKKGDAVTANHVLPEKKDLKEHQFIYGALVREGKQEIYKVQMVARFEASDFAIFKIGLNDTSYFEINYDEQPLGTDVISFGIAEHDIYGRGKELRMLKGHMTMPVVNGVGELNFPIPSGMSGGPVIIGAKCVGFMLGNMKSEKLVERTEEITELINSVEKITFIESKEVLHYGFYRPFSI